MLSGAWHEFPKERSTCVVDPRLKGNFYSGVISPVNRPWFFLSRTFCCISGSAFNFDALFTNCAARLRFLAI